MLAKIFLFLVILWFITVVGMLAAVYAPKEYHCTDYEKVHELNGCHGQGHFP